MTYLYVERNGVAGVFTSAPGDNAWTDESEWQEIRSEDLRVFKFEEDAVFELQGDGTWTVVKGWYRT